MKYFSLCVFFLLLVVSSAYFVSTSTPTPNPHFGRILLGNEGLYDVLPRDEQLIVRSVRPDVDIVQDDGNGTCVLKYYNSEVVLVYCAEGGKPPSMGVYSNKTKQRITNTSENIVVFEGFYESSSIIFSVANERITYFKPGFQTTKSVGIKISNGNESYIKKLLLRSDYDFSYDEQSSNITVGVFKNKDSDGSFGREKLRDETYVLN